MKTLVKNLTTTVLALSCFLLFAQASFAKPNWVKTTTKLSLTVVGKDITKPGYLAIKLVVNHKNKSKNGEVITAVYNKKHTLTATTEVLISKTGKFSRSITSSKVNKCEVYPGQNYKLTYYIPIDDKGIKKYFNSWKDQNEYLLRYYKSDGFKGLFKNTKWNYNFDVKTSR